MYQTDETDKFNRVDIKAKDSKDEIIIVEIQNTRELYYLERILYGAAKASAPGLPEARRKLCYYDMTPGERLAYDRHMDSIVIQNDVLSASKEEGLAKGLAKGIRLIATNLKTQGLSAETIAQCTGMSIEEIELL